VRTNLLVPFAEKDAAKKLGARWDATRKVWYVESVENLAAFSKWLPGQQAAPVATAGKPPVRSAAPKPRASAPTGDVKVGAHYFPLPCDCLPWAGCEKCRPLVAAAGWGGKCLPP
jgi:hypothetical protein